MILTDTNILIEIYRNNTLIVETVKKIGQENIAVSDITCAELYFGARNKKELQTIAKDLKKVRDSSYRRRNIPKGCNIS